MPELVEMLCSESHGAQSAELRRGDSVHVPLCRENTILGPFNLVKKVIVSTNTCPWF